MDTKLIRLRTLLIAATALTPATTFAVETLPPRALARIGDHRFYHGPGIASAVLSPDGRRAASSAGDAVIVLWNAATGERIREWHVAQGYISRLAFSPNGKRLAAVYGIPLSKSTIAVFDVESGKLLRKIGNFDTDITGVSQLRFSSDGKQLLRSGPESPSVWDVATGKQLRCWKPPQVPPQKQLSRNVGHGALSPDGRILVWEMQRAIGGLNPWITDCLTFRDAKTNKLLYQIKFEPSEQRYGEWIAFSANSKRFATGYRDENFDKKLTVWETESGKKRAVLDVPKLSRFALTPDGRHAVTVDENYRLCLWDIETRKPLWHLSLGLSDWKYGSWAAPVFSADGKALLLATNSTLRIFDTANGKERAGPVHRSPVAPRFSTNGRTLFTCCGEKRCKWDVSSKGKPRRLHCERRKTWEKDCLAQSRDDRLFLRSELFGASVRETASNCVLCEIKADHPPFTLKGRFSPDATQVLLYKTLAPVRLYDTRTGKVSSQIESLGMGLQGDPAFCGNGHLLAWADDTDAIHLYDAATGKRVRTLRSSRPLPHREWMINTLLFSPDSEYLLERHSTLPLRVFHVAGGREILRFYANPDKQSEAGPLSCIAWSPDGRLLAIAEKGSGIVRLLEIASGKVRAEFIGHRHGIHGLAFAPDGRILASGGEDNVVFLWDVNGTRTTSIGNKTIAEWWNDLAGANGKRAGEAIAALLRKPEASVAFLQQRLRPAELPNEKRLSQLLADLDCDSYQKREAASRELAQLGELTETALRRALQDRPSLEMRRRLEDLLDKLQRRQLPSEILRILRSIEMLEHLDTPEARRCLEVMAKGTPQAQQTREAKQSLRRLSKRRE